MKKTPCRCGTGPCLGSELLFDQFICLREAALVALKSEPAEPSIPVSVLRALRETWAEYRSRNRDQTEGFYRGMKHCIADLDRLLPPGDQEPRR